MYVYMYVCIYVCMYVCMYVVSMYVCMYVCTYVCTNVYMNVCRFGAKIIRRVRRNGEIIILLSLPHFNFGKFGEVNLKTEYYFPL